MTAHRSTGGGPAILTPRRGALVVGVCLLLVSLVVLAGPVTDARATSEPILGSTETFWAMDWSTSSYKQIEAEVRFVGQQDVIYVHNKALIPDSMVAALGTAFDTVVYPAVTAAYGAEPNPGIDDDPRVVILIYDFYNSAIEGSFNPRDIQPNGSAISNQREMFYLNQQAIIYEPQNAGALAAHEFAHLILHYRDMMLDPSPQAAPEVEWLTEGFTTYAEHLAGYNARVQSQLLAFTNDPDVSLTRWLGNRANYGASYAFMRYLADRMGPDFIRTLAEQPLDGVAGLNATLQAFDVFQTLQHCLRRLGGGQLPRRALARVSTLHIWRSHGGAANPIVPAGDLPLLGTTRSRTTARSTSTSRSRRAGLPFRPSSTGPSKAPLQAALISWDSAGLLLPTVNASTLPIRLWVVR